MGGFNLPERFLSNALRSNQNNIRGWGETDWQGKRWYCFNSKPMYVNPKDQGAGLTAERKAEIINIPVDHFVSSELEYVKKYLDDQNNNHDNAQNRTSPESNPANLPTDARENNKLDQSGASAQPDASNATSNTSTCNASAPSSSEPTKPDKHKKYTGGPRTMLPLKVPDGGRIGKTVHEIGMYELVARMAEDHCRQCRGYGKLEVTERYKINFQVFETSSCSFCHFQRTIHGWPEDDGDRKPGGQINLNDECLVHAAHGSAVTMEMLTEFFDQAGIVRSPAK